MSKLFCFVGLVSLMFVSICSADTVTIVSSSYTVTGFVSLFGTPASYSLTDSSYAHSSISLFDPQGLFGGGIAESSAGGSTSGVFLYTNARATGQGIAGAFASALVTFQAPSDLLVVKTSFSYHVPDMSPVSGSFTLTDLNTSAIVGTRAFQNPPYYAGSGTQNATDNFLIDHTHIYSLSMSLNDRDGRESTSGDGGSFSLALNPPPVPLPSALPMGLVLAALIGLGVGTRREGKGAGAR